MAHTETREHPDSHCCLASVKCARQFASLFADMSIIDTCHKIINVERGEALCDIWRFLERKFDAHYVDTLTNPFENVKIKGTDKERAEELIRRDKIQKE
ncbi:unnamed protein product [Rhizophagus irregularis]|nr:unnamed protein product [Rhizophagus irregularis]CAB4432423.1 unnamed protein product [Rhizophagus irregularis]